MVESDNPNLLAITPTGISRVSSWAIRSLVAASMFLLRCLAIFQPHTIRGRDRTNRLTMHSGAEFLATVGTTPNAVSLVEGGRENGW